MAYRVAVASTDGKVVNEHFGRSRQFYIFEVAGENYEYIERRIVFPGCSDDPNHEGRLEDVVEALSDCRYVMVARIGMGGQDALAARGIQAMQVGDYIERALQNLISFS